MFTSIMVSFQTKTNMKCADVTDSWRRNPRPRTFSRKAFRAIRPMRSHQRIQLQETPRSQGTLPSIHPNPSTYRPQNYMMLISMRIRMQGFVVFDFESKYPQARKELAQWLSEGKLKRKETIVKGGISKAEEALVGLFAGKNIGTFSAHVTHLNANVEINIRNHRQNNGRSRKARRRESEIVVNTNVSCIINMPPRIGGEPLNASHTTSPISLMSHMPCPAHPHRLSQISTPQPITTSSKPLTQNYPKPNLPRNHKQH
jgi:hypothetical protein